MWRNLGLLHIGDVENFFKFFTCGEISDFYTSVMHKNLKFLHMTIFSPHISYVIYVTNMRFAPHYTSPNLKYFRFADKQMIKYLHFLIHFWIKCNYRLSQVLMWRTSSPFSEKIALHPMQSKKWNNSKSSSAVSFVFLLIRFISILITNILSSYILLSWHWFFQSIHTVVSGHQNNQSPDQSMLLELQKN